MGILVQHARRDRLSRLCLPIHPHPSNPEMMDPNGCTYVCAGVGEHRFGGVTRTVFKIARAQTETQGEGGARGRPLGNATGRPSIHSSNASCQRWREVRGKARRPRAGHDGYHHDHSHRRLVRKKNRREDQTDRRARPGGRAAAATDATAGSDRGRERHITLNVAAAACPVRHYLLIVGHRAPATDVMPFFFFKTPLLCRKAERFRQPLIRSNPEFAGNPFETIRTHARNTLIPHHLPTT
jgi:hypothetical protein